MLVRGFGSSADFLGIDVEEKPEGEKEAEAEMDDVQ